MATRGCPCGYYGDPKRACKCTPQQTARYHNRLSGPLRDRIDLIVEVEAVPIAHLTEGPPGESSAAVRARVLQARERQLSRTCRARINAQLTGTELKRVAPLQTACRRLLERSSERLHLSARAFHRVIRVSRTIADLAGRLTTVTRDGAPLATYTYDANGNRTSVTTSAGTVVATYDNQDRLLTFGDRTYTHTAHGEVQSWTDTSGTTTLTYDVQGNLLAVQLPSGTTVEYVVDARNRRIGRKVNGVVTHRWLYQGQLRPVAELDASGAVLTRFVYGARAVAPEYMIRGGVTYRLITDQLGSVRLVVDIASGAIAQRIDYDTWGRVLTDTSPGFQTFGFAGGLYDPDTGLTRFGARDYDPASGRWAAKDPILFAGGDTHLYAYCGSDPVNCIDPSGLWVGVDDAVFAGTGALVGVAGRAVGDFLTGDLSSWEDYAGAAVGGAVGGETLLYTANPFLAGAAGGLAGNLTGQGLKNLTGKQCGIDVGSAVFDTAFGTATGFIPGRPRVPGINSGRGSALGVFRQIVTKVSSGTINNVSWRTAAKMAVGAYYQYAFAQGAAAGALGSTLYGTLFPTR
jgi:RHS repeat-associated protein